jgi:hypothetical protein
LPARNSTSRRETRRINNDAKSPKTPNPGANGALRQSPSPHLRPSYPTPRPSPTGYPVSI